MSVELTGDITDAASFKALIDRLFDDIRNQLPQVAESYRSQFVNTALSSSGPRTLGQITGALASSLTVQVEEIGEAGGLRVFVPEGTDQYLYGSIQDDRKGWFQFGIDQTKAYLEERLAEIIKQATEKQNG